MASSAVGRALLALGSLPGLASSAGLCCSRLAAAAACSSSGRALLAEFHSTAQCLGRRDPRTRKGEFGGPGAKLPLMQEVPEGGCNNTRRPPPPAPSHARLPARFRALAYSQTSAFPT